MWIFPGPVAPLIFKNPRYIVDHDVPALTTAVYAFDEICVAAVTDAVSTIILPDETL